MPKSWLMQEHIFIFIAILFLSVAIFLVLMTLLTSSGHNHRKGLHVAPVNLHLRSDSVRSEKKPTSSPVVEEYMATIGAIYRDTPLEAFSLSRLLLIGASP